VDGNSFNGGTLKDKALYKAIKYDRPIIVRRLFQHGAVANPTDLRCPPMKFPLSIACAKKNLTMITLLLANGADPFLRTIGDLCPFDVALSAGHSESIKFLLDHSHAFHNSNRDLAVKGSILALDSEKIKILLELHVGDYPVECLAKFLHETIKLGNLEIVQLLLDSGASIDYLLPQSMRFDPIISLHVDGPIEKPADSTALMQACRFRHVAIVKELLNRGADVNVTNSFGWTALLATVAGINRSPLSAQERNLQIAELLIQNGAYVNPGDGLGIKNSGCLETQLPSPLERVKETIDQFSLFHNQSLLQIAVTLVKAGARSSWPIVHFPLKLNAHDPRAMNASTRELARICIKSSEPFGKVFHHQRMMWSRVTTNMAEFIRNSMEQTLTLQSLCCLKLRRVIRPPLTVNLKSGDIPLPPLLKSNILELL
jgi:ankyrin repeat protein